MINRSPWLWGTRKSAAGMTGRTSNGIQILQGKRAKGQSNPSEEFLSNQAVAKLIWPLFRAAQGFIRALWTSVPTGAYAANEFFRVNRANAIDFTDPLVPTVELPNLIFSRGTMTATPNGAVVADVSDMSVKVTQSTIPLDGSQSIQDTRGMVVHNRTQGKWYSIEEYSQRATFPIDDVTLPENFMIVGDNIDVYTSYKGYPGEINEGTTSESVYSTTVAVA